MAQKKKKKKSIPLNLCSSVFAPQAPFYMQVVVDGEENKSFIFPKQSLLLWPITSPCFQVLITGLLDCQLRKAEGEKERERAGGGLQKSRTQEYTGRKLKKMVCFARVSREGGLGLGCAEQTPVHVNAVSVWGGLGCVHGGWGGV